MSRIDFVFAAALAGATAIITDAPAAETAYPIAAWSRTTAASQAGAPIERGAAVYNNWCEACHARDPDNAAGTRSLALKYQGKTPAALADRRDLTAEAVKFYVRNGVATMPFFRKTEINDEDLDALAAFLAQSR